MEGMSSGSKVVGFGETLGHVGGGRGAAKKGKIWRGGGDAGKGDVLAPLVRNGLAGVWPG